MDDDTDVSALIDAGETERVHTWIDDAVAEGATRGRRRPDRGHACWPRPC